MDCDGVKNGYDLELTRAVSECVHVPVIASGGAGKMAKFECVFPSGYSFNDILQYFHTHLTKNHGECTGSSDYSSERARVAVRCMSDTV